AESANPFAQRESIVMLGELGGKEIADFLADLAQRTASDGLKKHIAKVTATLPAKPLSAEALVLLDRVVNADAEGKKRAAVVLSEEFGKPAAEALHKVVKDLVSDDDARTFAALAIVHINAGSVADLESLCVRTNHKTLRYCAVKELADKGAEGEAVLRKLAADPTEPLKKQIDALLAPPEK
ncbi:MAG: hypothetical protein K8T20_06640, partial [Planctomycetes bacterium]|nr:hypothetical protein [Planctomycetota bacterium]